MEETLRRTERILFERLGRFLRDAWITFATKRFANGMNGRWGFSIFFSYDTLFPFGSLLRFASCPIQQLFPLLLASWSLVCSLYQGLCTIATTSCLTNQSVCQLFLIEDWFSAGGHFVRERLSFSMERPLRENDRSNSRYCLQYIFLSLRI